MATFLLQAAGQAIGTAVGGPIGGIVGRIAGAAAGSVIDAAIIGGSPARSTSGPRLGDLNGIASAEGAPIPRLYGRQRLGGQVIWATQFEEVVSTSKVSGGGKGLGGTSATETTFSYFANVAVALCEGPIAFVRRVWADGDLLDLATVAMRVHTGDEEQVPDPLIIAKDGAANACPYRGTAYVVFERLPLAEYGNRLPQLTFEVTMAANPLARRLRSVNLIPGSGEFVYDTQAISRSYGFGATQSENRHQGEAPVDWTASLDQLQALCPRLESVSLVVAWFGDDLRAGHCTVSPRVDLLGKATSGEPWSVSGISRTAARLASQVDGHAAFGGTPSDASVLRAVADLKARGLKVAFYPFLMLDIPAGNALPDPIDGGTNQPAYPWRGRITAASADDVATFFGTVAADDFTIVGGRVVYAGPPEWSLRRQVLHDAWLCRAAGGVDAFVIASELVDLTRFESTPGVFPAVGALRALAADVRRVLGRDTRITYAADWTEYGATLLPSGDLRFPLDPLWASADIDAVGIDWYPPLSDWRDGRTHADAAIAGSALDADYLTARVGSGEAFDWYYADADARQAQDRTPITDGAYGKPWVFRPKDLAGWWLNAHVERVAGTELPTSTVWTPGSKPVWLIEAGSPAVDRGGNAPNVFPDYRDAGGELPHFSRGVRDDLAQSRVVEAILRFFDPDDPLHPAGANPVGPDGLRMVDVARVGLWAWDARPFPAFPYRTDVWADGVNWSNGHWLNGRLEGLPLDRLVERLAADLGDLPVEAGALEGFVDGYLIDRTMSAREAIEPLAALFGFDAAMRGGKLTFLRRDGAVVATLSDDDLIPDEDGQLVSRGRAEESDLPREVSFTFVDAENDYRSAVVSSRRIEGASRRDSRSTVAVATRRPLVQRLADVALQEAWLGRETATARLRPGLVALEVGDIVSLPVEGADRLYRITRITDADDRRIEARATEPTLADLAPGPAPLSSLKGPPVAGPPAALVLDLPLAAAEPTPLQYLAVAADPWPAGFTLWRSPDGDGYSPLASVLQPSLIGETTTPLGPGPLWRFDRMNALGVRLSRDGLVSVDPLRALAGDTLIAIQGEDGVWELLAYVEAELVGDRQWMLRGLLRGLGASEAVAGRALPTGRPVVAIDRSLTGLTSAIDDVGLDWRYRLVRRGADLADGSAFDFEATPTPLVLRPYAPVRAAARRVAGGIAISFIRRTRRDGDGWELAEVPLAEEREAYEIDILAGGLVRRTLATATASALYTDELVDFGGPQVSLNLRICQLGAIAGRGFPLEVTVPVR